MVSQIVEEFQAKKAKSKLNQARILVTGSSGFIGSAIFNNLKSDFQVTGLSRKSEAGLKMDLFKEQIDLSDFEYVIHAAGLAHLKQTDKDAMHQNNVLATRFFAVPWLFTEYKMVLRLKSLKLPHQMTLMVHPSYRPRN